MFIKKKLKKYLNKFSIGRKFYMDSKKVEIVSEPKLYPEIGWVATVKDVINEIDDHWIYKRSEEEKNLFSFIMNTFPNVSQLQVFNYTNRKYLDIDFIDE